MLGRRVGDTSTQEVHARAFLPDIGSDANGGFD